MNGKNKERVLRAWIAMICAWLSVSVAQASADPEVLTRGPVHEAFAVAVPRDVQQGLVVSVKPPELIEELPPEQQPEGENVAWIPGYWAWDDERKEFLWVSGVWRNLPPGRQWVPGYWTEVRGGYQWVAGYWEDAAVRDVTYLPAPPRSLEIGPSVTAVAADQIWVPGTWVWHDSRYFWRAGYWIPAREDWIWTPAYYRWTHRGYVFVDGFWDYAVARRGVLFAPVYFGSAFDFHVGYFYRPTTVIRLSAFVDHLFLRPGYSHYYFGDYYAPHYREVGIYPSYAYHFSHFGYDPIYAHVRWTHRDDPRWDERRREFYEYRRDHESARPPRSWGELVARNGAEQGIADRLDRLAGNREGFRPVDRQDRERFSTQRQDVRRFARERQALETAGTPAEPGKAEARRLGVPRSPIAARPLESLSKRDLPPSRVESSRPAAAARPSDRVAPPTPLQARSRETLRERVVPRPELSPRQDQPSRRSVSPPEPRVLPEPRVQRVPPSRVAPPVQPRREQFQPPQRPRESLQPRIQPAPSRAQPRIESRRIAPGALPESRRQSH